MFRLFGIILEAVLAVSSWVQPQPALSYGMLYAYGNQNLIQANADWHGYSLRPTRGCGFASISPAMLGRTAWISVDGLHWVGPCRVVDVDGRDDALGAIYYRHEIGEISFDMLHSFGYQYGTVGYIYFGPFPRLAASFTPQRYAPPEYLDYPPYDTTPSFYPYPDPEVARIGPIAQDGFLASRRRITHLWP